MILKIFFLWVVLVGNVCATEILITGLSNPHTKKFTGKKLSLNFQNVKVRTILQLLATVSDKNIIINDSVDGYVSLRLKQVPWDQVLDIILEARGLKKRQKDNVIWIAPAVEIETKEQQELLVLKRKQELAPLVTKYIVINHAKVSDLVQLIQGKSSVEKQSLLSSRGSVSLDKRTNTLLLRDTLNQIKEITQLIRVLDVPVKQVLIEARIVVANNLFAKNIGVRFGVTGFKSLSGENSGIALSGSNNATNQLLESIATGTANPFSVGLPALTDRLNVNLPVLSPMGGLGFSILSKDFLVDLELSALQAESKGEIIATPRVITANQHKASIEQGVEIPYQESTSSGATNVAFKKAVLSMEVTPQITADNRVLMELEVKQNTVGQIYAGVPSINTRVIKTKVLIENGQTIVLGGVHENSQLKEVDKVPFLGDLPGIGWIFRQKRNSNTQRELLIFVTPRIVK